MIHPVEPKKVLCIHDLSGMGRCSLAVILPVLSVMGVQPVALPTVVLSTHTGGLGTPARLDGSAYGQQALEQANYTAGKDSLYINAHGTGTKLNDSSETTAIKLALGEEDAKRARISSTKSMTGHMLGAAGAVEAIFTAMALKDGFLPATIGYEVPDPECDLDITPNKAVEMPINVAISNSLGFGGHNACILIKKV